MCVSSFNATCILCMYGDNTNSESQKHYIKYLTGRKKNKKGGKNHICYYLLVSLKGKYDKVIKIKTC